MHLVGALLDVYFLFAAYSLALLTVALAVSIARELVVLTVVFCHSLIAFLFLGFFLWTSLLIDLAKVDFAHQLDVSDIFLVRNQADIVAALGFVLVAFGSVRSILYFRLHRLLLRCLRLFCRLILRLGCLWCLRLGFFRFNLFHRLLLGLWSHDGSFRLLGSRCYFGIDFGLHLRLRFLLGLGLFGSLHLAGGEVDFANEFRTLHSGSQAVGRGCLAGVLLVAVLVLSFVAVACNSFGGLLVFVVFAKSIHQYLLLLVGNTRIGRILLSGHIFLFEIFEEGCNSYIKFFCYFTYLCGHKI